ncbi:MAG: SDR family NAD(P)-dependent oxidoreductase [Pseudomonadota bacterium]
MTDASRPLFLYGPGYSARYLADIWPAPVFGTVRSQQSAEKLSPTRIEPVPIDDEAALKARVAEADIVISAPPEDAGCPAFARIARFADQAHSITYLSTTGVYGDLAGGWAMEWMPTHPQSQRAERRVKAETQWRQVSARLMIVRLPGIYGPGRSAFDRLNAGTARRVVKPGQVFSRIHVADIATGLRALLLSNAEGVFNLCDEYAAPPEDVITYAADLLGEAPPPEVPFEAVELTPMGRSFYAECKRVSNAKIKAATGWRPEYPTYKQGLKAILEQMA